MLIDARRAQAPAGDCDVAIVGGGVAGITLALLLGRSGRAVCLIEGGDLRFSRSSQALYDGVASDGRYSLTATRTRMLGGSSNCWGGWTRPFGPLDFAPRPWIGVPGWPIGLDDITPHHAAAAALLEVAPPEPDNRITERLTPELRECAGIGRDRFGTIYFGMSPPTNFGRAYRDELADAPGIAVLLNAMVTAIMPEAGRVAGVRVRAEERSFELRPKVVVLAAGGIENPRLLLASGGIGNGRDLVGRYFMDHPRIRVPHLQLEAPETFASLYDVRRYTGGGLFAKRGRTGAAFMPRPSEQRRAGVLQAYSGLVPYYFGRRDAELEGAREMYNAIIGRVHRRVTPHMIGEALTGLPTAIGYYVSRRFDLRGRRPKFEFETVTEPFPDRENRVELTGATDRFGMPKVRLTWRKHPLELRTQRHSVELISRELEAGGHGRVEIDPAIWEPGPWEAAVMTTWHHMGTTRMATSPSDGVVDPDCRVFGVSNLFVTGSSVFPTGGGAPPTFMLTALAARLASHISRLLSRPAFAEASVAGG